MRSEWKEVPCHQRDTFEGGAGRANCLAELLDFYTEQHPGRARCLEICEVGVLYGDVAERLLLSFSGAKYTCVDPWMEQPESVYQDDVNRQDILNDAESITRARLARFGSQCSFHKAFSPEVASIFDDHTFDLVFIDGNHGEDAVCNDVIAWSTKIRTGGILAGHDYVKGWESVMNGVNRGLQACGLPQPTSDWVDNYRRSSVWWVIV